MSAASRRIARRVSSVLLLAGLLAGLAASPASALTLDVSGLRSDADDIQAVYVEATTGQFRLEYAPPTAPVGPGVSETADISATATGAEVQSALNALANISAGGGSVRVVKAATAEGDGNRPFLVTFDGGPLGMRLQTLMTAKQGTTPLGASPLGGGPAMAYVATRLPGGVSHSDEPSTTRSPSGTPPRLRARPRLAMCSSVWAARSRAASR